MECPTALYVWGKFNETLKTIIMREVTPKEKKYSARSVPLSKVENI